MPTIKELYSLIQFSGVNGPDNTVTTGYVPFIDDTYFDFVYGPEGSTDIGLRVIDCQDWTSNIYVSKVMNNQTADFGVNFADGRIKGYNVYVPSTGEDNTKYVRYVRGNTSYGINDFQDNGDNTITDHATNLMWSKNDSQVGLDWPSALAWVQTQNDANYLGHNDWRIPDAKELQSIVDYTRSPATTNSPAIDVNYFNSTSITNEAGQEDYPYIWSGSVLIDGGPKPSAIYIPFGRAMGYMSNDGGWIDVHGAGSQKSDFMVGDPEDYPTGLGPQGDTVRIYNYVRLVRDETSSLAPRSITVKFKAPSDWTTCNLWAWDYTQNNLAGGDSWPGTAVMTLGSDGFYSYTLDDISTVSVNLLFNNGAASSTAQTVDLSTENSVCWESGDLSDGKYTASLTNDCNIPSAITEQEIVNIQVLPNPTTGKISIISEEDILLITVLDFASKSLFETEESRFDISHLPAGMYFLKIDFTNNQTSVIEKMVKK